MRIAPLAVAEMPLAANGGGIAARREKLRDRDLPRQQALRQPRGNRLQRAGADRVAAGHQLGARRHAIALHVEIQEAQPFRGERVDARRRRAAQHAAAVAAELAPAEVVGEDQYDVRRGAQSVLIFSSPTRRRYFW